MKNCFVGTDILLPKFSGEPEKMTKWACIACDQYTSEAEYWDDVEKIVADSPSTARLILPEFYLDETEKRIPVINETMKRYLSEGIFEKHENSMIYLERTLNNGKVRHGLIGAVDLEKYDYNKGASSLIRATEGTVLDRIPPRVKIRSGAVVELPHIMILIDDPEKSVIEPLKGLDLPSVYDFDLMKNSGHVKGALLPEAEQERIKSALSALCVGENPLLFAMGDGNHSLASAKAYWEELKPSLSDEEKEDHPARYALAEIVNIHDESLEFEPIYRVIFGVDPTELIGELKAYSASLKPNSIPSQKLTLVYGDKLEELVIENPTSFLPVGSLQTFLDSYVKSHPSAKLDYIHGIESTKKLSASDNTVGFIFEGMKKPELFPTVIADGALPRKTFSMGEADDKRFYIEARKIVL